MEIRPFRLEDEAAVVSLWRQCDLVRPWNDPRKDMHRKRYSMRPAKAATEAAEPPPDAAKSSDLEEVKTLLEAS